MADIIVKLGDQVVQKYSVTTESITVGRARDNEIVVENLSVSRNHARIRRENGVYTLADLGSANGTFLNGVKVSTAELKDNDIISIGKHKLHFTLEAHELRPVSVVETVETGPYVPPAAPVAPSGAEYPISADAQDAAGFGDWGFLLVTRGKQSNVLFRLQAEETSIGRANENDIRLHDWFVSKRHAIILRDADGFLVRDLGSWRGITLNGAPIRESRIKHGDELVFGTTVVRFNIGPEDLRIEGAVLSTELPSEVQMPEAPEGAMSGEPADYIASEASRAYQGGDDIASLDSVSLQEIEDDEYAPLTDEELAQLELEHDEALEGISAADASDHSEAEWEQLEAERMMAEGAGWRKGAVESDVEDDAAFEQPDSHALLDDPEIAGQASMEDEDQEEEDGLFGGPVSHVEPGALESSQPEKAPAAKAGAAQAGGAKAMDVPEGVDPTEFRKWSRGLRNKSRIVRREAARKLKELTGIDYEWESDPE